MASPIIMLIKLLLDPDVSKKVILQMAWSQVKAIGIGKVVAALLSALTVGVSSFIRVPQIRKLLINSEQDRIAVAKGLSLTSLSLDTLNSLIHVTFNSQNRIPFIQYGESLLLGIQNAIIILLIKFYRGQETQGVGKWQGLSCEDKFATIRGAITKPLVIMVASAIFFNKLAPSSLISMLEILNIPISIVAKFPQIKTNYELKTAKHLSDTVLRANVVGSLIRVYTSFTDYSTKKQRHKNTVDETILLAGYSTSLILNSILLGQSIVYDKMGEKKVEDEKKNE
ncbi:mannose-p-dolichol utilization defect 1 protein (suppressor of lec15 and lec35 glycosylation mutation homolog) (sl15), putative [Candida dubliniensis CD36]|uniref:Solute carrier family 66 member 3 n=1 Tax=Candida dubliniensis (strain CD36 / ATCC MYA-646 / CBS 7987 / NCPF 3949 / NRRL Y-17841) TaxID=573826 RepID=B9WB12_CANDC|nr:mannose-p-dolichol utilization defect 1 protein (suppressor of lec15 and lec35 glycosylation mutation homolog) (sl15), putative [Candida dubliniensis CD36]CAX43582.1 mannose-p-dolichol utilization defect 1 protein (suppressor of lec15 and lec35 glycosylation mutation homolog) (sl15), putative [Candida dubliniensis CD36]